MPAPTPFPQINTTDIVGIAKYVNEQTSYMFGPITLVMIWFVCFLSISASTPKMKAIATSNFITFIAAGLLYAVGLIPGRDAVFIAVALLASAVFIVFKSENQP